MPKIYCANGCGNSTEKTTYIPSEDINRTLYHWECGDCIPWSQKPSLYGIKCKRCDKVLTQGEEKTCRGRSIGSDKPDFFCNDCYENRDNVAYSPSLSSDSLFYQQPIFQNTTSSESRVMSLEEENARLREELRINREQLAKANSDLEKEKLKNSDTKPEVIQIQTPDYRYRN